MTKKRTYVWSCRKYGDKCRVYADAKGVSQGKGCEDATWQKHCIANAITRDLKKEKKPRSLAKLISKYEKRIIFNNHENAVNESKKEQKKTHKAEKKEAKKAKEREQSAKKTKRAHPADAHRKISEDWEEQMKKIAENEWKAKEEKKERNRKKRAEAAASSSSSI